MKKQKIITTYRYFIKVNKRGLILLYDSIKMVERIKKVAKEKRIPLKVLLLECGLGINALNQIKPGSEFSSKSLLLIADRLEVSVDYLLGRTDNPEVNR